VSICRLIAADLDLLVVSGGDEMTRDYGTDAVGSLKPYVWT
jgi:hypothetical protein